MGRSGCVLNKRSVILYVGVCVAVLCMHTLINYRQIGRRHTASKPERENLLVLATTITDSVEKRHINQNTLTLWPLLGPEIKPVLYVDVNDRCCANLPNEWTMQDIPETGGAGLPVLKSMMAQSMQLFDADFYGFANGDILFGNNLLNTLHSIKERLPELHKPLLVGRRTNVRITQMDELTSLDHVFNLAQENGVLFHSGAEDYFITTNGGFDWREIPEFVIGRRGFDNWIVAYAISRNFTVIDVTNTVTAVHQTGSDGNWAGHRHTDPNINMRLSGPFRYRRGFLLCAQYQTNFDVNGKVWIGRKSVDSSYCLNK